jgi:hypothetical protein
MKIAGKVRARRLVAARRIESGPLRGFGFPAVRGDRQKMPAERFFNAPLTTH